MGFGSGEGEGSQHLQDRRIVHDLVERGGVLGVGPPLVPPLRLEVVRVRIRGWD